MHKTLFPLRATAAVVLLALFLHGCGGEKPEAMLASARDYLAKNDPKAAVIQLKNVLQENPDQAEARFLLGQALLRGGDPVGAEAELRKALQLKHPSEQVVPVLAQTMLGMGQFKKITDEFSKTQLAQGPANAGLQTTLSTAYRAQGNAEAARAALAAALAADPGYGPALIQQARERSASKDYDAALATLEQVLSKSPNDVEALKLKGDVLLTGKGQFDEGVAAYRKAVEIKPDFVPGHGALMSALLSKSRFEDAAKQLDQLKKAAPTNPQTRYFETLLAYYRKDFKLARELSQQLMKVAPNNVQALQLSGAIELQNNSLLQAETYLNKAVQATPDFLLARRMLATTYLKLGQPAKALTTLQPALKGDTADPAVLSLAGEAYLQSGDTKKAEEYFAKATQKDPKNARARTSLALAHLASGRGDAAFGELQDVAASDSGITADMALINAHLMRKNYDKALKAIDALEKKQPNSPLAPNLRGRTLIAKQDFAGARKSFERAVALEPTYFAAVGSLAALDMADKKPDEARKRFEALLTKDPKNSQALLALAELNARTAGKKEESAELITRAINANPADKQSRLQLVELYLRQRDYKQALSAAQNGVAALPDSPELLDALGRAQQASGDTNQAVATFTKLATTQPPSPLGHMRMADLYASKKDHASATQSLRKALEVKPDLIEAQRNLMILAVESKNYSEANKIARTIQKQRPTDPLGYKFEGDVASSQQKWDDAVVAYRNGLKQAPSSDLAVKIHAALGASGKTAEVDKFSSDWLRQYPKDVAYRLYLGDYAGARRDYAGAEKMYGSVLQIQADNSMALNNMAWAGGKLKRDYAIGYAEKAVALSPQQPAYMDTLAVLLSDKGNYDKAVEWQTKAITIAPQNNSLKLNLAKIHIKGGKKDLARQQLDELTKLGKAYPGQAEVADLLKTL